MSITPIPRTISEIVALTQATTPSQTVANFTVAATWEQDAYASAPIDSPYPSYGKPASPPGSVPASPYTSKIDFMSDAEIWAEATRLDKENLTMDYTGMSDVEIYQAIYDRHADAFGEAFLNAPGYLAITEAKNYALAVFESALKRQLGSIDNVYAVNKERLGFSGMTYAEAEQTVMQKYAGKTLTVRDMSQITFELCNMGYIKEGAGPFNAFQNYIFASVDMRDKAAVSIFLDSPFDMTNAKKALESVFVSGTPENQLMTTKLYAMFTSLINNGLYEADKELFDTLMDHLTQNISTTTIGG